LTAASTPPQQPPHLNSSLDASTAASNILTAWTMSY
jgi:hypothetical protein